MIGLQIPTEPHAKGSSKVFYMRTPLLPHLRQIRSNSLSLPSDTDTSSSKIIDAGPSLQQHLTTTISWDNAEALALDGFVAKILKQLDVDEG